VTPCIRVEGLSFEVGKFGSAVCPAKFLLEEAMGLEIFLVSSTGYVLRQCRREELNSKLLYRFKLPNACR
jgi:hypothetical protein